MASRRWLVIFGARSDDCALFDDDGMRDFQARTAQGLADPSNAANGTLLRAVNEALRVWMVQKRASRNASVEIVAL